jgi:CheY-like chemotaxis protein
MHKSCYGAGRFERGDMDGMISEQYRYDDDVMTHFRRGKGRCRPAIGQHGPHLQHVGGRLQPGSLLENRSSRNAAAGETILLVEDENSVRRAVLLYLRRLGYTVIEAPDAESALVSAADVNQRIDVVFTDIVMPGMDGLQLVDQLLRARPELGVVLTSGHIPGAKTERRIAGREFPFLQKPYSLSELTNALREAIGARPSRADESSSAKRPNTCGSRQG